MALEFNAKLNKPGLGGSFGKKKTSDVSSQAARNLASGTAANKTSLFSLKSTKKYNFVAGQSYKSNINKYNYQGMRARFNSRAYTPPSNVSAGMPAYSMPNQISINSGNNAYMKGQVIGQIVNGTFSLLNELGIFDGLKGGGNTNSTQGKVLDDAMRSLGGNSVVQSGGASGVISSMASATDSATLRGAIGEARGQLTSMDAQTGSLEAASVKAEQNKATLESNVKSAKSDVKEKEQSLKNADNAVDIQTKNRDSKKLALKNADSAYGKASDEYSSAQQVHANAKQATAQAEQGLANAQAALNAIPNTPENAAQRAAAQRAVDAAEQRLENAKAEEQKAADAENKAKEAKEKAYNELGEAKTAVDNAEKDLKDAQSKLDKAKDAQAKAAKDLKESETKLDKAEQELQSAEGAIEKFKQHKKNVSELQKAIEKGQQRLIKLEQEEQESFEKLTEKINAGVAKNEKRSNSIDTSDGMNIAERFRSMRMDRTNKKSEARLQEKEALSANVSDTQYIQEQTKIGNADFTVNGQKYQKLTTPSGNEVYCKDGKVISEEEYNIGRKQAGLGS